MCFHNYCIVLEVNFEKEQYAVTEGQSINVTIEANVEASMPYSVSVTPGENDGKCHKHYINYLRQMKLKLRLSVLW